MAILAVWIVSFFAPALADGSYALPGYRAALFSGLGLFLAARNLISGDHSDILYLLYVGSFCFANVFMILAPIALRDLRRGRGKAFLVLMTFWDLLTFSWFYFVHFRGDVGPIHFGWWMWEASLFAMTAFLSIVWFQAQGRPVER